jgi:hypothetical protein
VACQLRRGIAAAQPPVISRKYQDRILFATDASSHGDEFPQQVFNDKLYEIYYRFLETDDEYFDYAPAKIPPQGRWRIYRINLPECLRFCWSPLLWNNAGVEVWDDSRIEYPTRFAASHMLVYHLTRLARAQSKE